jgi:lysophospholipase L1-like esterase
MATLYDKVAQFQADADLTHKYVHGPATGPNSVIATESGPVPTLAKQRADLAAELGADATVTQSGVNAAAAAASASAALTALAGAVTEKLSAENAKTGAEIARDAAQLSAGIYLTTAAGISATNATANKYFSVPSAVSAEYLILYCNNAGVAVEQKRYPAAAKVQALDDWVLLLCADGDVANVGNFIHKATGEVVGSASFRCSDFVEIMPSTSYLIRSKTAGNGAHAWFDTNMAFISSFGYNKNNEDDTVLSPASAKYVRFSQLVGASYVFSARTSAADYNIKRLRAVLALHAPDVDATKVLRNGLALTNVLTSIEASQAAIAASQANAYDLMMLVALDSGSRKIFKNRVASIGDSTMRGTYGGDSEPGVDGALRLTAGDSWLSHACFYSNQKITRVANCGDIGATVQELRNHFAVDIVAKKPDVVIISGGTNNAALIPATTAAAYKAVVEEMVLAAIAACITPVLAAVLPSANSTAYAMNVTYNTQLQALCAQYGLLYLDIYTFALDVATGGLKAAYSGDGVHPSAFGQQQIGRYVASLLMPRVIGMTPPLAVTGVEATNLITNPLFVGTPGANGNAPSWLIAGVLPTGCTASVVTEPGVAGKMQRLVAVGSAGVGSLIQYIPTARWAVGNLLEITGKYKADSGTRCSVELDVSGVTVTPLATALAGSGTFHMRCRVQSGATYLSLMLRIDAGTGGFQVGQVMLRNLTAEGLDVSQQDGGWIQ